MESSLNRNIVIKEGRGKGNTTRIINEAVEILFNNGEVKLKDHWDHREADKYLLDAVINRLRRENRFDYLEKEKHIIVNKKDNTISLSKEYFAKIKEVRLV